MNNQRYWNYDRGNRSYWMGGRNEGTNRRNTKNFRSRGDNRSQNHQFRNNVPRWQKARKDVPPKRLSEEDIGVTEFLSDHKGFTGVIKTRYSDFQVSEINTKGEVAELTELSAPQPPVEAEEEEDEDLLLSKYNLEIMSTEVWDKISKLVECKDETSEVVEIDATEMTKEQRTKIHESIKKVFGKAIVGSTVNEGDKKYVRFTKYRKGVRIDKRVKWMWPGEYVYFILHKENCDTMEAAARVAGRLRVNLHPSLLGYAGTKDRRAKTSQWISLRKVDPRRIAGACRDLKDIQVGNYSFHDVPLKLGMLNGNKFRIAIRNVTVSEEIVSTACESLRTRGFLNYYGLQRFGTRADVPTHHIGLKVLKGDFQGAIDSILEERECAIQHALRVYRQYGPEPAVMALPKFAPQSMLETRLLRALARYPQDILGAFNSLPRNTRLLYPHAYQALVWNRCVSERMRRFGLAPHVGDLVAPRHIQTESLDEAYSDIYDNTNVDEEVEDPENTDETEDDEAEQDSTNTDPQDITEKDDSDLLKDADNVKSGIPLKILTQEDIDSGHYTIYDVVMPLPGNSIEYPPNMKDYYEELLTKDGLTLEMRHKFRSYCMRGAYRRLCVVPNDVTWSLVRYDSPYADLILSDIEKIQGRKLLGDLEGGRYKALLLTMSLPSSCYATMALRDLLKTGTSGDFQAKQNNYHEENIKKEKSDTEDGEGNEREAVEIVCKVEGNGDETKEESVEKRKIDDEGEEVDIKKVKSA